jgi:DNA-directed RNA polymerase specialized sigma24 family protein
MTTISPLAHAARTPCSRAPHATLASPAMRRMLQGYVARRVPAADVDDVVQATLCDALASGRAPVPADELGRWVLGIARFKVVDAHRAAARRHGGEPAELPCPPPPVEERSLLRWAERELPRGAEATLRWLLREADGEKLEAIAADEALPAVRVRQRVSRLRRFLRGRWTAEMALVATLALAAIVVGRAIARRQEAILPEPAVATAPRDARIEGAWRVVSLAPRAPLPPARQAIVDRLWPALTATFDGRGLRIASPAHGLDRTFVTRASAGGPLNFMEAVDASRGDRFTASYAWDGEDLVVTVAEGPWAGIARLRPAR